MTTTQAREISDFLEWDCGWSGIERSFALFAVAFVIDAIYAGRRNE
jgi:hypothetical protein